MAINTSQATESYFTVQNLHKSFSPQGRGSLLSRLLGKERDVIKAVDGVSVDIKKGEILGLAGQSGCGKSTFGELLVGLQKPTDGNIVWKGEDITTYDGEQMKEYRKHCQVIFQDPYEAMNPRFTVARTVAEPLSVPNIGDREERDTRIKRALEESGLTPPGKYLDKLPQELSGGERQRVCIARALVLDPEFIIADEPVSMLDVSVRTGILHTFQRLQEEHDITMVYISHDLSTIEYLSDRTMIMYLGNAVEIGETERVIQNPAHPYTKTLLDAVPSPDPTQSRVGSNIGDEPPDPGDLPNGCRFHPLCSYATEQCRESEPDLDALSAWYDGDLQAKTSQEVACYHPIVDKDR